MKKINKIKLPIKIHGEKHNLTPWILKYFPKNYKELAYCEPFCGSCSILFAKEPSNEEVISDLNPEITTILKALRDDFNEFSKKLKKQKISEAIFKKMIKSSSEKDYVIAGVKNYVVKRISKNGMGKSFFNPSDNFSFQKDLKTLNLIAKRLENVIVLNEHALSLIKAWDEENCLIYIDPPILSTVGTDDSEFSMTIDDHIELLSLIKNCKAKVLINSHTSSLYKNTLTHWKCVKMPGHKIGKMECLWKNY